MSGGSRVPPEQPGDHPRRRRLAAGVATLSITALLAGGAVVAWHYHTAMSPSSASSKEHGGPQHGGPQHGGPQHGGPQHGGPQASRDAAVTRRIDLTDAEIDDLTWVMAQSPAAKLPGGRPSAAVTGSWPLAMNPARTSDAWIVEVTPQLAMAVWAGIATAGTTPRAS